MTITKNILKAGGSGLAVVCMLGFGGVANAQNVGQDEAAEDENVIIVTATKRAENVQDVPIAITAFGGEALEKAGVDTLQDVQFLAPSLSLPQAANPNNARIVIRGVGSVGNSGIEPSVATFIDGVYMRVPARCLVICAILRR